jgi:hypothetical protein
MQCRGDVGGRGVSKLEVRDLTEGWAYLHEQVVIISIYIIINNKPK